MIHLALFFVHRSVSDQWNLVVHQISNKKFCQGRRVDPTGGSNVQNDHDFLKYYDTCYIYKKKGQEKKSWRSL